MSPIAEHLGRLENPRAASGRQHLLLDIMVIAICAVICGADNWLLKQETTAKGGIKAKQLRAARSKNYLTWALSSLTTWNAIALHVRVPPGGGAAMVCERPTIGLLSIERYVPLAKQASHLGSIRKRRQKGIDGRDARFADRARAIEVIVAQLALAPGPEDVLELGFGQRGAGQLGALVRDPLCVRAVAAVAFPFLIEHFAPRDKLVIRRGRRCRHGCRRGVCLDDRGGLLPDVRRLGSGIRDERGLLLWGGCCAGL